MIQCDIIPSMSLPDNLERRPTAADLENEGTNHHPVHEWAQAVLHGTSDPVLRERVVDMYGDLPVVLNNGGFWAHSDYAEGVDWRDIEPELTATALALPSETSEQKEIIGFATLVNDSIRGKWGGNGAFYPRGISLSTLEFLARHNFNEDFHDSEDWLGAIGNVVKIQGRQVEADEKFKALEVNSAVLASLPTSLTITDLERMYEDTVKTIRPNAQQVPIFREGENNFDAPLKTKIFVYRTGNQSLARFIRGRTSSARRDIMEDYLQEYNRLLNQPQGGEKEALSWIYGVFLHMHPHWDYNGTMARTLVNGYLLRRGFQPIDWQSVKESHEIGEQLDTGLLEYSNNRLYVLQQWFGNQLENLSTKNFI